MKNANHTTSKLSTWGLLTRTALTGSLLLGWGTAAMAQQTQDTVDSDVIVVTAQKRSQSSQDVPLAISAIGGKALERTGALDFKALADHAPGLAVTGGSDAFARSYIRGIGTNDTGIGAEPSVGVYIDGVYAARLGGALTDLVDVDRVEILKGPQGTLFGRNSIAGAISVITKKPDNDLNGMIGTEFGRFNEFAMRAMLNVPLVEDALIVRASGAYRKGDGWQINTVNGSRGATHDRYNLAFKTLLRPASNVEVTLSNMFSHADEIAPYAENLVPGAFAPMLNPLTTVTTDRFAVNGGKDFYGNAARDRAATPPVYRRNLQQHALTIGWDINDAFKLTSLTSYRRYETSSARDYDGTQLFLGENSASLERNRTFSQELRLNGKSKLVDWFLGASYTRERNYLDFTIGLFDFGPFLLGRPINGYAPFSEVGKSQVGSTSWAVYGDATFHLTDKLNVTTGGRWSRDTKYIDYLNPNNVPGVTGAVGLGGYGFVMATAAQFVNEAGVVDPSLQHRNGSWSNFSPRIVFDYKIAPDAMLFAGVTRGYKSGAFNSTPSPITVATSPLFLKVAPDQTRAVSPETATNFEGGIKSQWLDRKLTLNLSAFYQKFKDLQVQQIIGATNQLANAGKASNRGVELEMRLRPISNLTLMASGTWMDAKYDLYSRGSTNFAGTPLLFSPKLAGSLGLDYGLDLGSAGSLDFYTSFSYKGKYRIYEGFTEQPGYGTLDARITYANTTRDLEVSIFGKNLTDKAAIVAYSGVASPFGVIAGYRNEPFTFGASVKLTFE